MPLDETIERDDVKTATIKKLQILFDNVNQAVFLFNFTGKILDVNKTACKLLDYSKEELLKLDLHNIIPPEFVSKITKGIKSTLENGKKTFESTLVRRDKKKLSVEISIKIIELINSNAIFLTAQENEDWKKRETQFIELEKFYHQDPNPFLRTNENSILYCNRASQKLFNFRQGDNLPKVLQESVRNSINNKSSIELEIDLNSQILLLNIIPIQEDNHVNIYVRDITDRKKTDKIIKYLAKFPSENPNPMLWVSKDSVLYSNEAGVKLFNVKKGGNIPEFLRTAVKNALNKNVLSEQEIEFNNRIYLLNVSRKQNQDFVSIQGVDISERKKSEKILRDYSQRMEFLNHIIKTGNVASNVNSLLEEILKSTLELMGFDGGLIYLAKDSEKTAELFCFQDISQDFLEKIKIIKYVKEHFKTIFIKGEPLFIEDYTKFNSQEALLSKFLSLASIPIFSKDKIIGTITIASKKKFKFSHEEKEMLEFIGREIGSLIIKMHTEEALREARDITDFYRDLVVHDISNILQNINTSVELISIFQKKEEKLEKIIELIEIVKEQIVRGSKLVTNIRNLSKISDAGIHLESIEALEVLNDAVKFIQGSFSNKDINIQIDSQIKKVFVQANKYLLDVFENILFNSIKYNDNPTVEILIRIHKPNYKSEGQNYIKIEFMDNGIGIPDDRKEIILKRSSEGKQTVKGMGIGLFTVNKIVKNYKGKIWVEDRIKGDPSKGSNFIILIPV